MAQVLPALDGDSVPEGLDEHDLLELYRRMVLLRVFDERAVVYHRQGRIGTYALFWNHEAIQVGASYALRDSDWIFPSYRESAIGLVRGLPPATVLQWWRGHPSGWWSPAEWNLGSICVPIATHVPHAAGLAWGKKLHGEDVVAMVFFGDGATSEGAFHEGVNLAAVMEAPLVLVCNNNQWAISTLIEAVHYRATPHATADNPRLYIDLERVEQERERECLGRFERYLRRLRVVDDDVVERTRRAAEDAMRAAIAAAEAEPRPDPELVFRHAYADPPPNLRDG